jgi:hypothetical protein
MMRIWGGLGIWSKCVDFDVLNIFVDTWVSFFFLICDMISRGGLIVIKIQNDKSMEYWWNCVDFGI